MNVLSRSLAAALLLALCGCESAGAPEGGGLNLNVALFRRGQNVTCADAPEIANLRVTLFNETGQVPRAGWPRETGACVDSYSAPDALPGNYVLEVQAIGELEGDSEAVLFSARSDLTLPATGTIDLSLEPRVAWLDLDWSFGPNADPCGSGEVASISALVSAGAGSAFMRSYACDEGPIQIDRPFSLQRYTIRVSGLSDAGAPLYTGETQRTFDRGLNEYTAVLTPQGGQLLIDFDFSVRGLATRMCDEPTVMADDIVATVEYLEGGLPPATETFACEQTRPYAFRSARFTQGRELALTLEAEAEHRFLTREVFTMPGADYRTGLLTLAAVGTASISVSVQTSTCSAPTEAFEVTVVPSGQTTPVFETSLDGQSTGTPVEDLPYGDYQVQIDQIVSGATFCSASESRTIDGRNNVWDPFVF